MKKMNNNATDENIEHFDNEMDMADLEGLEGMKFGNIMPQVDCCVFTDGPDVIVLSSRRLLTDTFSLENWNVARITSSSSPLKRKV